MTAHKGSEAALKPLAPFDVVYYLPERRGGCWGWFEDRGAGPKFIAPGGTATRRKADEMRNTLAELTGASQHVALLTCA